MKTKPNLTIFRGMPGSGKSSAAFKLGCLVLEPCDQMAVVSGEYQWSPAIPEELFSFIDEMLSSAVLFEMDVAIAEVLPSLADVVGIVDDWEAHFKVKVIDMPIISVEESFRRNNHGVQLGDIESFHRNFQPWHESHTASQITGEMV